MTAARLPRLLAQDPGGYARLVAMWTVARLAIIAVGLLVQQVFDALTADEPATLTIVSLAAVIFGTEAAKIAIWYGGVLSRMEPRFTYTMRARLRANTLRTLLRRPAGNALGMPVGDALSRTGADVDEAGVFAIWSASNVARMLIALTAIGIMLSISAPVTVGVVVPLILVVLAGRTLNGRLGRYRTAAREAAAEVSTAVSEALVAAVAIKAGRAEGRVVERVRALNARRARATVREQVFGTVQETLFQQAAALGTGLLLLLAAGQLAAGAFTVGDLALFVFYLGFLTEAVWALGMFFTRSKRAALSLDRLATLAGDGGALLARTPAHVDGPPPWSPPAPRAAPAAVLSARGLAFRHPGAKVGLRDIDLDVPAGSFTVITGRVGAGKTTLLRVLLGILPRDAGEIRWDGEPVADPATFFRPPRCAYTPQVPRLFDGTLRDNVVLGAAVDDERVAAAIRDARLSADLADLPDGLDTRVGARGRQLSGGQAQRVAVSRTLVRRPALMVFDDLSNALDAATEQALWQAVARRGEVTVLAVGHRRGLLRGADRIVVLDQGRVDSVGTLDELLRESAEMRAIWGHVAENGDSPAPSGGP